MNTECFIKMKLSKTISCMMFLYYVPDMFAVVVNAHIAQGTQYKFVFHNIPDNAKEDTLYAPVSMDLPGKTLPSYLLGCVYTSIQLKMMN